MNSYWLRRYSTLTGKVYWSCNLLEFFNPWINCSTLELRNAHDPCIINYFKALVPGGISWVQAWFLTLSLWGLNCKKLWLLYWTPYWGKKTSFRLALIVVLKLALNTRFQAKDLAEDVQRPTPLLRCLQQTIPRSRGTPSTRQRSASRRCGSSKILPLLLQAVVRSVAEGLNFSSIDLIDVLLKFSWFEVSWPWSS